jgi:hypothetical protein
MSDHLRAQIKVNGTHASGMILTTRINFLEHDGGVRTVRIALSLCMVAWL